MVGKSIFGMAYFQFAIVLGRIYKSSSGVFLLGGGRLKLFSGPKNDFEGLQQVTTRTGQGLSAVSERIKILEE